MSKAIPSQALRNARLLRDPTCSKCGITKTVADFHKTGVDYWCKECRKHYARAQYHKVRAEMDPEQLRAMRAKVNRKQNEARRHRMATLPSESVAELRERSAMYAKRNRQALRDAVYGAYGGYKCNCCGETEVSFLSLDHVENDGAQHKRANNLKTTDQILKWLVNNGFPPGFQILCMNCQWGKRNNAGRCPHQGRCNDYPARE